MFFLARTWIIFLQISHSIIFYLTGACSKDDVSALQGLFLGEKNFFRNQYQHGSWKIIRFFTSSIALMLLNFYLTFSETGSILIC